VAIGKVLKIKPTQTVTKK